MGLAPTGKRRLLTAHARSGRSAKHEVRKFVASLDPGPFVLQLPEQSHQSLGAGAPAGDERCDERRPTCLMRRAEPLSSLAVEVLVEEDAIA